MSDATVAPATFQPTDEQIAAYKATTKKIIKRGLIGAGITAAVVFTALAVRNAVNNAKNDTAEIE